MSQLITVATEFKVTERSIREAFWSRSKKYQRAMAGETGRAVRAQRKRTTKMIVSEVKKRRLVRPGYPTERLKKVIHMNPGNTNLSPLHIKTGFIRTIEVSNIPMGWTHLPRVRLVRRKVKVKGKRRKQYRYRVMGRVVGVAEISKGAWLIDPNSKKWKRRYTKGDTAAIRRKGPERYKTESATSPSIPTLLRRAKAERGIQLRSRQQFLEDLGKRMRGVHRRLN